MRAVAFPTHIQIQTTTACGADCTICPHPRQSPLWANGAMSDALFERIVDQLVGRPIASLSPYLMADGLADKKIFARIGTLRDALPRTHLELSTTGKYLVPSIADRLLAAPLSEVRISSHGVSASEYALTMPGVDHARAMAHIRRFIAAWQVDRPFELRVVTLWGLWSREREAQIDAFWADLGVETIKWRVVTRARGVDLTVFGEGSPDPTPFHDGKREPPYVCRFGRDTEWMHILSDGRVTLCCMDYGQEEILGDAKTQALEEIWQSEAYRRIRAKVRGDSPAERRFLCNRCEWHVSEAVAENQAAVGDMLVSVEVGQ